MFTSERILDVGSVMVLDVSADFVEKAMWSECLNDLSLDMLLLCLASSYIRRETVFDLRCRSLTFKTTSFSRTMFQVIHRSADDIKLTTPTRSTRRTSPSRRLLSRLRQAWPASSEPALDKQSTVDVDSFVVHTEEQEYSDSSTDTSPSIIL